MSILSTAGRVTAVTMDQFDITGYYNEYKFKRDAALIDVTPFGYRVAVDLAGIQKAGIELKGMYNATHDTTIHTRFGQDQDVYLALGPTGYKPMAPVVMLPSVITKYDVSAKAKDAVMLDSMFSLRGSVDDGVMLLSPKTILSGASGVSGTYDNGVIGGATTAGGAAQLHIWSIGGTTPSLTVKIQDSADGTTFADVTGLSFSAATTVGVQRLDLDFGNTVRQYVRATWALTGTSATARVLAGFARGVDYQ